MHVASVPSIWSERSTQFGARCEPSRSYHPGLCFASYIYRPWLEGWRHHEEMNTLSGRSSAPASPGPTTNFRDLSAIHLPPPSSEFFPFDDGANENAPPSNPPSTARQFSSTPSTSAGNPTLPLDPSSALFQNHASWFTTNDHLTVALDEKATPLWTAVKGNGDAIQLLRQAVKENGDIIQKNGVALFAIKKNGEAMKEEIDKNGAAIKKLQDFVNERLPLVESKVDKVMEMLNERLPPRPTCAEPS